MLSIKSLLVPAILAAAVASAMAADDDGTFTINIQGPDESTTVFQNQQENALQANPQRADGSNANAARRNVSTRPRSRQTASSYRVPRPASEVLNTAKPVGSAQNTSSSTAMQGSYTVGSSDTMWSIATRYLPPDRSVNEFQIVASIYRHNPNAFIGGNVNRLRAGRISIPSLSEIARESSATGSELLERGTMQLPALATTQPAKSSDHAAATSNSRQILDRASQLPSFQATENLVKNARAERQAELEQQTALSVSSPSSQTEDASQNRDPLTKAANEAVADAQGDKETSKPSSAQQEPQKTTAVSASPAANSYSSDNQVAKNFDPDALRIMLEGSQKQIDKRMLDINQKLMDSIERMQKANEAVIKSTDSAVASLAKQYDGMLAELQQNVMELKGGLAAMERDTANMREMILANDEKLEALQVSLADGKLGGLPEKSDYQKSYIYLIAGIGFLTLLLLSLFVFVKLKSRARKRSLQQDLSELSDESTTTADDELLSDTVAKEGSGTQDEKVQNSDAQQAWNKAAAEVARDEDGEVNSEDQADKEAKELWNKALQHGSEEAVDTVNQEGDASEKAGHAASDSQPQDEVASDDEGPVTNGGTDPQSSNEPAKDQELSDAWSQALAEQKASDEKEKADDTALEKEDLKSKENNSEQDELSKYIGSSGNEWLDNTGSEKSEEGASPDVKQVAAEPDAAASLKETPQDDEEQVNQKDLADAWEAALAEQQAQSSTYDNEEASSTDSNGTNGTNEDKLSEAGDLNAPKNEASAEKAEAVGAENVQDAKDSVNTDADHAETASADLNKIQGADKKAETDSAEPEASDDALSFEKAMKEAASTYGSDVKQDDESGDSLQGDRESSYEKSDADDHGHDEILKKVQDAPEPSEYAVYPDDVSEHNQKDEHAQTHLEASALKQSSKEPYVLDDLKQAADPQAEKQHELSDDALSFEKAMQHFSASSEDDGKGSDDPVADQASAALTNENTQAESQKDVQTAPEEASTEQTADEPKQNAELQQKSADDPIKNDFEDLLQNISNGTQKILPDEQLHQDESGSFDGQFTDHSDNHGQDLTDEHLKDRDVQADKKAFDAVMHTLAGESEHEYANLQEDGQISTEDASALFAKDFAAMISGSGKQNEPKEPETGILNDPQSANINNDSDHESENLQNEMSSALQVPKAEPVAETNDDHALNLEQENSSEIKKVQDQQQKEHDEEKAVLQTQDETKNPDLTDETVPLSSDEKSSYQEDQDEPSEKASDELSQDESYAAEDNVNQAEGVPEQFEKPDQDATDEDAYLKIPQKESSSLQSVEHWFVPDDEQDVPGLELEGGSYPDGDSQEDKAQLPDEDKESVPPEEHWDDLEKQSQDQQSYSPFNWTVPKGEDFDALENSISEGASDETERQDKAGENIQTKDLMPENDDLNLTSGDQADVGHDGEKIDLEGNSNDASAKLDINLPEEQGHFSATYESSDPQTEAIVKMLAKGIPEQELEDHDEALNALDDEALARMVSDEVPEESFGSVYENGTSSDRKNRSEGRNRGLSKDAAADILKRGAFKDVLKDRK